MIERLREPTWLWAHAVHEATEALMVGEPDRAESLADRALRIGMDTGQPDALSFYGGQLAVVRLQQGRMGELVPLIEQLLDEHPDAPAYRAVLVAALVDGDEESRARGLLEEAASDGFASVPEDAAWLDTILSYAYSAIELRAASVAQLLFDLLAPYRDQIANEQLTSNNGPVANPLGGLAAVLGRYDEAESYLSRAAELTTRGNLRFAETRGHLALGRMLQARDRPGDLDRAREHLELARRQSLERGYARQVRLAEAELAGLPDR